MFAPGAIEELIDVAFVLLTSHARKSKYPDYECAVSKAQVMWYVLFQMFL